MYIIILLNIVMFRVWASTTGVFVFGSWLENTNFEPLFQGWPICGLRRYSRMQLSSYLQQAKLKFFFLMHLYKKKKMLLLYRYNS